MALFSDEYQADPHPALAELRQAGPVHRVVPATNVPFWLVTRWAEARQILADPSLSKRQPVDGLPQELRAVLSAQLLLQDPPDHTRLRRLVSGAFTPRRVADLRPRIERITDRLLDGLTGTPEVDLIDALAFPLPLEVICELLGIPVEERGSFRGWSNTIILGDLASTDLAEAVRQLSAYLRGLFPRKRAQPTDDLLGALLAVEGDRLDPDELISMAVLLLVAGHETTVNLIGNAVYLLDRWPEQKRRLLDDPGLVPAAIEEVLRMASPTAMTTYRVTTQPITVGDTTIPAGEQVLISLLSVNRDDDRFTDPDTFEPSRADGGHLSFGHGIHFCLGAPLARLEGQIAIGRLLARYPDIRLAGPWQELRWRPGLLMHGLTTLPVRVLP
ncbi:cytochrome P450 family protein [Actinoplanes siamensis]|uniref:Cytochrome P450 hydroxylase n=1 Tax=Actinoplanes siamensis TaxID=1223317 RepID=A0A919N9E2_9ACTN|nr:cytochrome P450 [Actinoplanes siamensis]GIF06881.1 cytochrome P450 hydroxylase [Actinoplanes siamensis]